MLDSPFSQPLSRSSLVHLLIWNPLLHTPYICTIYKTAITMYNSTSKLHDKNLLLSLFIKPDEFSSIGTVVRAFQKGPWPVPTVHKCSHPKHEQEGLVGQLANPHLSGKQPLTQRLLRRHSFPEPLHVLPVICAILISSPWGDPA